VEDALAFHPLMLSHPLDDDLAGINAQDFAAEWKYDGIRVQLIARDGRARLYSRSGDDISETFPDLISGLSGDAALDGELLIKRGGGIASFNELQQRLNRKQPSRKLMEEYPPHLAVYDMLSSGGEDVRSLAWVKRRQRLEDWLAAHPDPRLSLSEVLPYSDVSELQVLRLQADRSSGNHVEGLMLKRKASPYIAGRPKGHWYKWKREPLAVDAVLMYAQRGSGKRSSYYSDYTFGLWQDGALLPIGKAYSGFTDEELRRLDNWIRAHTINQFGPVREVTKALVFEVVFDSVHRSKRHKSGYALRFPRISRIRWDKPAAEADLLTALEPHTQTREAAD
jgi:DNA ligase-1